MSRELNRDGNWSVGVAPRPRSFPPTTRLNWGGRATLLLVMTITIKMARVMVILTMVLVMRMTMITEKMMITTKSKVSGSQSGVNRALK